MSEDTNNLAERLATELAAKSREWWHRFHALAYDAVMVDVENAVDGIAEMIAPLLSQVPPATSPASEAGKATPDEFKAYVHRRLDEAGVPTHPDGPHSKEGCRIGDRLDIVFAETNRLVGTLSRLRELAGERQEAYRLVAATGSAADVRRMEGIDDEVFRILAEKTK